MGKPVRVVSKRSLPATSYVRYELDRSLTGMGHESYATPEEAHGSRPCDVLAFRLFETGMVSSVHLHSNVVTVGLVDSSSAVTAVDDAIRHLFTHYLPGVLPTAV